ALVTRPSVLLLDEPLGALDKKLRDHMKIELKRLQREVGITTIYVTHDQEEAFVISDKVIVMDRGHVLQYATPDEIYNRPTSHFVASFIGRSVLVDGQVLRADGEDCWVTVPEFNRATLVCQRTQNTVAGGTCQLAIRTGEIKLNSRKFDHANNVLEGFMTSRDYRGGLTDHRIRVGSREIVVTSHKLCPMINIDEDGEKIFLHIDKSAISIIAAHAPGRAQQASA
ncbi:MAG: ABC transporter ATP-binding protein, partial [Gammaproteobacteria bacterium]